MTDNTDGRVRIVGRDILHKGFVRLERVLVEQKMSWGKTLRLEREIHDHGNAAAILLFDPVRHSVVLVRQLRVPVMLNGDPAFVLEIPAGLLDDDTPDVAIRREAMEETGYHVEEAHYLFNIYASPGTLMERVSCFYAKVDLDVKSGAGGGLEDEHEDIEVVDMPLDEAYDLIASGGIIDAKTIILLQWAKLNLDRLTA